MSAFGNYNKDQIVESIKDLAKEKKEQNPDIKISEVVNEIMEAVNYGLDKAIFELEETNP